MAAPRSELGGSIHFLISKKHTQRCVKFIFRPTRFWEGQWVTKWKRLSSGMCAENVSSLFYGRGSFSESRKTPEYWFLSRKQNQKLLDDVFVCWNVVSVLKVRPELSFTFGKNNQTNAQHNNVSN